MKEMEKWLNTAKAPQKLIKKISKEDIINETVPHNDIEEAQAPSFKPQANRPQAPSRKHQAPSNKPQA
jgi:hypothetical protein